MKMRRNLEKNTILWIENIGKKNLHCLLLLSQKEAQCHHNWNAAPRPMSKPLFNISPIFSTASCCLNSLSPSSPPYIPLYPLSPPLLWQMSHWCGFWSIYPSKHFWSPVDTHFLILQIIQPFIEMCFTTCCFEVQPMQQCQCQKIQNSPANKGWKIRN